MKCPYCGKPKTKVIDSRSVEEESVTRRRRMCQECGSRFTTFERLERVRTTVVKRNGIREPYSRDKLASGMYKACNKRNVEPAVIEKAVDQIEEAITKLPEKEISASHIGDMVMEHLRRIDEVAYMRFASVYKRFANVSEFQQELGELLTEEMEEQG